ncbi:MAG: hypothetical protein ACYC27_16275 [Armatimonadota bacterium]
MSIELIHSQHGPRIHVPLDLKRRCGRKQIILPPEPEEDADTTELVVESEDTCRHHDALVIAIARALRWKKLLDEGKYPSVAAMAEDFGMSRWYLARLLRISLLAPDIIELIVDGREPEGMSIEKLRKPLPMLWSEQRALLGL